MALKNIARKVVNKLWRAREFQYKHVSEFAKKTYNKTILEVGSGIARNGEYVYSLEHYFDKSNTFIKTDVNAGFGHKVLDITKMSEKNKYDVILCLNVLEHVYDFQNAIDNIYNALKNEGVLIFAVPVFYPLHDEPGDYWRFTEHSLKIMFKNFTINKIEFKGPRQTPLTYYLELKK